MERIRAKQPGARRCISCRSVAPKEAFWRIVRVYPSHAVQLDRGMGRSAYLCPTDSCLKAARYKNRLGRALKTAIPDAIYQSLELRLGEGADSCWGNRNEKVEESSKVELDVAGHRSRLKQP